MNKIAKLSRREREEIFLATAHDIKLPEAMAENILSVNAIIAGFLFTGLSIIISVIDKDRIKRLMQNGYLDVFYNTIFAGIAFHIASILFSVMNMLNIFSGALVVFGYIEIGTLIIGLIVFVKAVLLLREIISIAKKID